MFTMSFALLALLLILAAAVSDVRTFGPPGGAVQASPARAMDCTQVAADWTDCTMPVQATAEEWSRRRVLPPAFEDLDARVAMLPESSKKRWRAWNPR